MIKEEDTWNDYAEDEDTWDEYTQDEEYIPKKSLKAYLAWIVSQIICTSKNVFARWFYIKIRLSILCIFAILGFAFSIAIDECTQNTTLPAVLLFIYALVLLVYAVKKFSTCVACREKVYAVCIADVSKETKHIVTQIKRTITLLYVVNDEEYCVDVSKGFFILFLYEFCGKKVFPEVFEKMLIKVNPLYPEKMIPEVGSVTDTLYSLAIICGSGYMMYYVFGYFMGLA
jgi:hypothetical protein